MAILSINLLPEREYNPNRSGRKATDQHLIISDIPNESPLAVELALAAVGIVRGAAYEGIDAALLLRDIQIRQGNNDERKKWLATVEYETGESTATTEDENPLDQPWQISWDDAETTEPIFEDALGLPIENSSGEIFDPPVTRLFFDQLLTVRRNVGNHNPAFARQFKGKVNSAPFNVDGQTINTGKALLIGWSGSSAVSNGVAYDEETIRIVMRDDGWIRNILDQGYTELVDGDNRVMTDDQGLPLNQPVKLDGAGAKLAEGAPAVFLQKQVYKTINFSGIGLV
jgi:hypothetical protein